MLVRHRVAVTLSFLLLVAACGTDDDRNAVSVEVLAGPHSVLSAVIRIDAAEPVRPSVTATAGDHLIEVPAPAEAARHLALPLVGMRADTTYTIAVHGGPAVTEAAADLTFATGSLPDDLPDVEVEADERATPGFTLFNASASDDTIEHPSTLIAVDETGAVVWYHQAERSMADVRRLGNGNLILNWDSTGAREIDVLGNLVREWTTASRVEQGRLDDRGRPTYSDDAIVLDTIRLHHEVAHELADGNFLALGMEVRPVDGFPEDLCGPDDPLPPGPRPQRGDIVIEFTPEGEIVTELPLLDAVDPRDVPGVAQCRTRHDPFVNGDRPYVDWTHGNSAEVFPADNLVLVSARHLNQVLALRWRDDDAGPAGELLWSLGAGGDFDLVDGTWFVQQHAPEVLPDGSILLYDNGTDRLGTIPAGGTEPPFSRAVVYQIDPPAGPGQRGTARQVWEHVAQGPGGPEYAALLGDADLVGDDHVLITHGAMVDPASGNLRARIIEVDRARGDIVLDINLPGGDIGWRTYRAEHVACLGPCSAGAASPSG